MKRILVCGLVAAMCLAFASCGNDDDYDGYNDENAYTYALSTNVEEAYGSYYAFSSLGSSEFLSNDDYYYNGSLLTLYGEIYASGYYWGKQKTITVYATTLGNVNDPYSVEDGVLTKAFNACQTNTVSSSVSYSDVIDDKTAACDMANAIFAGCVEHGVKEEEIAMPLYAVLTALTVTVCGPEEGSILMTGISVTNQAGSDTLQYDYATQKIVKPADAQDALVYARTWDSDKKPIRLTAGQTLTLTVFVPVVEVNASTPLRIAVYTLDGVGQETEITSLSQMTREASMRYSLKLPSFVLDDDLMIDGHHYLEIAGAKWAVDDCNTGCEWADGLLSSYNVTELAYLLGNEDGNISGNAAYDLATQEWGDAWCTPTREQYAELISSCDVCKVNSTAYLNSKNSCATIAFIYSTSYYSYYSEFYGTNKSYYQGCYYWTATPSEQSRAYAYCFYDGSSVYEYSVSQTSKVNNWTYTYPRIRPVVK